MTGIAARSKRERQTERIPLTCTRKWLETIDNWRFQNRISSRAAAIRLLAEHGLKAKGPASASTLPSQDHDPNPSKEQINELTNE